MLRDLLIIYLETTTPVRTLSRKTLDCNGYSCDKCGKCLDWYLADPDDEADNEFLRDRRLSGARTIASGDLYYVERYGAMCDLSTNKNCTRRLGPLNFTDYTRRDALSNALSKHNCTCPMKPAHWDLTSGS